MEVSDISSIHPPITKCRLILKPLSYSNVIYSGLADESTEVFMGEESES